MTRVKTGRRRVAQSHDRLLRAEIRAARRRVPGQGRRRVGFALCAAGLGLFVAGYVGAVSGTTILPFDPHHVIAQMGGWVIAAVGLALATARRR